MGKMSRDKGARFERQVAAMFREYGYDASRSAQHEGKTGQSHDIKGTPFLSVECKHQEKMHLYDWYEQSVTDAEAEGKGNVPVVIHKQNNKPILVTIGFDDFMKMYNEFVAGKEINEG